MAYHIPKAEYEHWIQLIRIHTHETKARIGIFWAVPFSGVHVSIKEHECRGVRRPQPVRTFKSNNSFLNPTFSRGTSPGLTLGLGGFNLGKGQMQGEHLKEYEAFGQVPFLANSLAGAIAEEGAGAM